MSTELPDFGSIRFAGTLRPSQASATSIIQPQLERGEKRLHIVAPPGSGKTILGLYVWSDLIRKPALVLSPNSAIQAQWAARTSLFDLDGKDEFISTDPKKPGLLTSLTYQSITMPRKGGEDLDEAALNLWAEKLIDEEQADGHESAEAWQKSLETSNPKYYTSRLSTYRKKVRDNVARKGNALWTLHESAKANLIRLKDVGIGLIILDECHHLMHHWGRILAEVKEFFDDPVVLGLTATPPDTEDLQGVDAERYKEFFGPVDYEVPVPALVRASNLAPYQDLCYFVRPAPHELQYIAGVDEQFETLLVDLCSPLAEGEEGRTKALDDWIYSSLQNRFNHRGESLSWTDFYSKNETYANNARRYLQLKNRTLPGGVPLVPIKEGDESWSRMSMLRSVLDRYVRHGLRLSQNKADHKRAESVVDRLRLLGVQITETGSRPCASPVGRVMAYASSKVEALNEIITVEMQALGPSIRAVIVTDFEKTSATALVEGVLDKEAGGAIAVFRSLVKHQASDRLDPILMTGSTVLVDDDLCERFLERAVQWVKDRGLQVTFRDQVHDGYHEIHGRGKHWVPRYYSLMITELFQEGFTKCLVGTRGLLGEGWDASRINVLIDMTTVTTSMSINQLRGRSIRLDKEWKEKVANNWDIVCVADEFTKGFDDYLRFKEKHKQLYGVCDDGAIERGVGHVHAAFNDVRPEGISEGMGMFNEEMIRRAMSRDHTRQLWRIGEPFGIDEKPAIEAEPGINFSNGFQFGEDKRVWTDASLTQAIGNAIVASLRELGEMTHVARAQGGDRGGGWVRFHLKNSTPEEAEMFSKALTEALGPLDKPRYVIARSSKFFDDTWLSKLMPEVLAVYLRKQRVSLMMYHAVPSCLANSKERALVYQRYWNKYVSPGEITFVRSANGKQLVERAQLEGLVPAFTLHQKTIYE